MTSSPGGNWWTASAGVAALALMRPWAILPVALVFGAVQVGGNAIRTLEVSSAVSAILQAMILMGALIVGVLVHYRIRWVASSSSATRTPEEAAAR